MDLNTSRAENSLASTVVPVDVAVEQMLPSLAAFPRGLCGERLEMAKCTCMLLMVKLTASVTGQVITAISTMDTEFKGDRLRLLRASGTRLKSGSRNGIKSDCLFRQSSFAGTGPNWPKGSENYF